MNEKEQLISVLQAIPWFQRMSEEHFIKMAKISQLVEVPSGKILFREGDETNDYLYIVVEGRVGIEIYIPGRGNVRIYTAEILDVISWSALVHVVRRTTGTARVLLDSRLIAIDTKKLLRLCEEDYHLGYIVMWQLSNVIATRLMLTRLQLLDLFAHPTPEEKHD